MSVFFLAKIKKISDPEKYKKYIEKASPIVIKNGGKYIFKSEQFKVLSGDWNMKKILLIEFEDIERLKQCFDCQEYKAIKHLREESIESEAVIIE